MSVRQPHIYARQPADVLATLLTLEAEGADVAAFDKVASEYRGGAIWPDEYDIVRDVQDLFHGKDADGKYKRLTPDEVDRAAITKALEAFDPDHEHYRWPFAQNAQAVYVGSNENYTVGKTYTLVKCYMSQSWNGDNCYVEVINDLGTLCGPGYEQFMLADEYHAINRARNAGGGRLTRLGYDCWTIPPQPGVGVPAEEPHFTDATIERLRAEGVFKDVRDGDHEVVRLHDLHWKVKKAKADVPPAVVLSNALARAMNDLGMGMLPGANLTKVAEAVIADLKLEKHL